MNKTIKIVFIILLTATILLSLPVLYILISGIIAGSFEWHPRTEDILINRVIYIVCSIAVIIFSIFVCIIIKKLVNSVKKNNNKPES